MQRIHTILRPAVRTFVDFCCGLVACCAALLQLGCSEAAAPPNLILVTLDTVRADRIGAYGHDAAHTPVLDGLAARGVLFEDAVAQATTTPPSHASILTGLEPPRHGLRRLSDQRLPETNRTLAEILRDHGYTTAAFVSALPLQRDARLDQGFDVYVEAWRGEHPHHVPADRIDARIFEWLDAQPRPPVFLWAHYFDAHHPYEPPPEIRERLGIEALVLHPPPRNMQRRQPDGRKRPPDDAVVERMRDLYDGEIASVDAAIGALFERLRAQGLLANAVVAVVADHGEHLGEQGYYFGHWDVLDETARVPMLLAHSDGRHAGTVVPQTVATVDLMPTLLAWLGVEAPADLDGRDLTPWLRGETLPERPAYTEQLEYFPVRAVRSGPWLLRQAAAPLQPLRDEPMRLGPRRQPFRDPASGRDPELAERRLREALEASARPADAHPSEPMALSDEVREQLRALGYAEDEAEDGAEDGAD